MSTSQSPASTVPSPSPTASPSSALSTPPSTSPRRPSFLGLWNPADLPASAAPALERQPRSLSIRTSEGRCVSLLNDEHAPCRLSSLSSAASTVSMDSDGRQYAHSAYGLRLSMPSNAPPLSHCIRRTHSSTMRRLPSPQLTPTRLPSLSALVQAATMIGDVPLPPAALRTPSYSPQNHHLQLHKPSPLPAYSQTTGPAAKRKYHCTFSGCGKSFTTSGHLSRHYRIHTGEKNYHCLYHGCTSRFSRQDNMMQHYRTHLSPRSRRNRNGPPSDEYQGGGAFAAVHPAAAGSAFHPYKRQPHLSPQQHSPHAYSQWPCF